MQAQSLRHQPSVDIEQAGANATWKQKNHDEQAEAAEACGRSGRSDRNACERPRRSGRGSPSAYRTGRAFGELGAGRYAAGVK